MVKTHSSESQGQEGTKHTSKQQQKTLSLLWVIYTMERFCNFQKYYVMF